MLPNDTLDIIDHAVKKGDRSRFIDEAVHFYAERISKANLQKQLREGAKKRARRDLNLVREWFPIDNELWQKRKKH